MLTTDDIHVIHPPQAARLAELAALAEENMRFHEEQNRDIYRNARRDRLDEVDVSTLLNVSHELYSSNKALVSAMKDFLLSVSTAGQIEDLPGIA
jgi:phosphate:Na+ symporter